MARSAALVEALKRELRARRLTYADVARHLAMSEASIKRLFSRRDFTLARLDRICELLGMEFSDLARAVATPEAVISRLSEAQERELVADPKLMLVALCALNHAPFEEIVRTYDLGEAECVRLLARLDRLKFLELLPGNRYRLLVSRAFSWIPGGPIHRLFKERACQDFFRADFDREHELLVLVNGRLSRASIAAILERLRRAAAEFAERRIDDARLPLAERRAITLLVAARRWEPAFVRQFRRAPPNAAAAAAPPTARGRRAP
ncbi:MAG: helix-turn-helix transcriptional regulator [Burkholderiales bacterium]|nr:helix-turn-helix transcriptional regulator [Burkholderiales bacterium]